MRATMILCLLLLQALFLYQPGYSFDASNRGPAFLIEPPSKTEFSNVSGTVVQCSADGYPPPVITWVKYDGNPTQDIPGLRQMRHDGSLVFPPFSGEDYRADVHAATYRCVATNVVGTIGSRNAHVRAVVLQRYEIRLFDEYVLKGNMAILRCPVPSFVSDYVKVTSWERTDGFLVTPEIISGKYGMLQNGDLYIRDAAEHDNSYSFRCHTENTVTREKKVSMNYSRVIVTEPHHSQPPRITRRTSRVVVPAGYRATLSCAAQGYPVPSYRWLRRIGGQLTHLNIGLSVRQEGGVLIFHKASFEDTGRYICAVTNTMGEDKVEIELIVEETLRLSVYPKEAKTDIGRAISFNCTIKGNAAGSVMWLKDMKFLSDSARISFPLPNILQLRQTKRQDAGMYQCFVHTDTDSAQAAARLIIGDVAPKLKVTFSDKVVRPGSYVSLSCVASGNPPPQIQWSLDSIWPLSTGPGVLISTYLLPSGDVVSHLNITSVDVTDSGMYECQAFNEAGSDQHFARLNVFGPIIIRPLSNLTALAKSKFSVLCPFGGYPYDSIIWKKEGRLLPLNQRHRVFPNGTFIITEVQPGLDDGRYSCEITSGQSLPASRSFSIVIRTGPRVSPFTFQDNLHEGMRTAVTCIVVAGDPPISIRWMKDGKELSKSSLDGKIIHEEGDFVSTYTINKLEYRHNGNYTCLATNDVATDSHSELLTVKVPPRWIIEPKDTSAVAGHPARIDCQADGVPEPHIRWKVATGHLSNQFKTIVSSSHVHILVNGSLNFRSVESTDEGSYLCEANNGVGSGLSTVLRFTVHSAPQFQSKFAVFSKRRGEKAIIECYAKGDHPIVFSWKKNRASIDPAAESRYMQISEEHGDGEKAKLVIEKVEREDSAVFTCIAVNEYGEESKNIQLIVQDIPDAPQNLEVHDVTSRSLRLTWNRPFDGNSPITQYTVNWRQLDGQPSLGPQTVSGTDTTLTIRGLVPMTRYFFRVKGENLLGQSQYSAEVAVTTLEEPPRKPPDLVKAVPTSSRSINVTWQKPSEDDNVSRVEGFYIGYKTRSSFKPYTFKSAHATEGELTQHFEITNLDRFTEYNIIVQAYNSRGAGPPSEEIIVRTLQFDPPSVPVVKSTYATSNTIKLVWEMKKIDNSPISGYILHYKTENDDWQETQLLGEQTVYLLRDLRCGTAYFCRITAFNEAGRGNHSEIIRVKTDGNPPIAPDKRLLLNMNSTSVCIHLSSWHNGGCPISFFIIQYRATNQQEWTLVSNNIIPEQHNITITDLSPGTWYSLLMTARNDAGATEAEYIFATLTLTGEHPPRPSGVSDVSGTIYRHLTITVPVVSSALVLVVVLCVVCQITRRRSSSGRPRTPDGTDSGDPIKPEQIPLSVTYDSSQEPAYFPAPYATSRVPCDRECSQSGTGNHQNMGTFGGTKSGYAYDIPYPQRRSEKMESNYAPPVIYFPIYRYSGVELRSYQEFAIYEVPDRGRMKDPRSRREEGDGNSSTESDNEDLLYTLHKGKVLREEARESETECDRLWKTFEENRYEGSSRWSTDHTVLA